MVKLMAGKHSDVDDGMDLTIDDFEDLDEVSVDELGSDAIEEVGDDLSEVEELEELEELTGFSAEGGVDEPTISLDEPADEERSESQFKPKKKGLLTSPSTWVLVLVVIGVLALMVWKLGAAGSPGTNAGSQDDWQPPENFPTQQGSSTAHNSEPAQSRPVVERNQESAPQAELVAEAVGQAPVIEPQAQQPVRSNEMAVQGTPNGGSMGSSGRTSDLGVEEMAPTAQSDRVVGGSFDEMAILASRINEIEQFMVSEEFVEALRQGVSRQIEADLEDERAQMRAEIRADMKDELAKMVRSLVSDGAQSQKAMVGSGASQSGPTQSQPARASRVAAASEGPVYEIMGSTEGLVFLKDASQGDGAESSEFSLMEGDKLRRFGEVVSINAMGCVRFDNGKTLPTKDRVCR